MAQPKPKFGLAAYIVLTVSIGLLIMLVIGMSVL